MSRPRSAYDGLCRCLRPAFKETARRTATKCAPTALTQIRVRPSQATPQSRWSQRRLFGTETAVSVSGDIAPLVAGKHDGRRALEVALAPASPTTEQLDDISTTTINEALLLIRSPEGSKLPRGSIDRHQRIVQLIGYLIQRRKVPLSSFIYECMMDAMVDPQGSAPGVRSLFKDMEKEGITPTETCCQSALAALAVHPDYTLRQQILTTMQDHWFTIDRHANQHILLGLLRDKQYELAYERLFEMLENNIHVNLWVFDIFVIVFGQQGFLDEMMQLLLRRKHAKGSDAVLSNLMFYVLDVSSQNFHYQGTIFAWNSAFRTGTMHAPDGVLENVLITAANHGDVDLATEVYGIISNRRKVQIHHYETLAEAFMNSGNMASTLRMFSIMHRDGVPVSRGGTRALFQILAKDERLASDLETAVRDTSKDSQIPPAIVAVLVEAISHSKGSEAAMKLYQDTESLTGEPPSIYTVQDMIVNSRATDTSRNLLNEYKQKFLGGEPPWRQGGVSSKLITACLEMDELDMAMAFAFQALKSKTSTYVYPWLRPLAQKAVEAEDRRVWELMDRLEEAKDQDALDTVQKVIRLKKMERKLDEWKDAKSANGE